MTQRYDHSYDLSYDHTYLDKNMVLDKLKPLYAQFLDCTRSRTRADDDDTVYICNVANSVPELKDIKPLTQLKNAKNLPKQKMTALLD